MFSPATPVRALTSWVRRPTPLRAHDLRSDVSSDVHSFVGKGIGEWGRRRAMILRVCDFGVIVIIKRFTQLPVALDDDFQKSGASTMLRLSRR